MSCTNEELTRLSGLIGLIYDGATAPERWSTHILPALSSYMESPVSWLFTTSHTPQTGGYLFNHGTDRDRVELYINKYQQHDVWIHAPRWPLKVLHLWPVKLPHPGHRKLMC